MVVRAMMVRRITRAASGVGLVLVLVAGCTGTPQLEGDESLGAADALWTAVTAKDDKLLDASESRIVELHRTTKMSDDVYEVLVGVISTARDGDWSGARGTLKDFVRGQRPQPH